AHQRLEMTQLAARGNPRLAVDARELRREGTSYTVDTLAELRTQLGAARAIYLILGADAFLRLPPWSRWLQLCDLAHDVVALRPGCDLAGALAGGSERARQWAARKAQEPAACAGLPSGRIVRLPIPLLEISASDIRARLSRG